MFSNVFMGVCFVIEISNSRCYMFVMSLSCDHRRFEVNGRKVHPAR